MFGFFAPTFRGSFLKSLSAGGLLALKFQLVSEVYGLMRQQLQGSFSPRPRFGPGAAYSVEPTFWKLTLLPWHEWHGLVFIGISPTICYLRKIPSKLKLLEKHFSTEAQWRMLPWQPPLSQSPLWRERCDSCLKLADLWFLGDLFRP